MDVDIDREVNSRTNRNIIETRSWNRFFQFFFKISSPRYLFLDLSIVLTTNAIILKILKSI